MSATIRKIYPHEVHLVNPICEAFAAECSYPGGFNANHFCTSWFKVIESGFGEIFVCELEGKVVGALGASFLQDLFSGLPTAHEAFWFVMPEARGQKCARQLMDAYFQEAKRRYCTQIFMAHLDLNSDRMEAFYTREGFTLAEKLYRKSL